MTTNVTRTTRASSRRRAGSARSLDDLTRRIGALWGVEPQVSTVLRQQLIEELHGLDTDVERLMLRSTADAVVPLDELRSCQQRYLWIRERWAAVPSPEGRAA